MAIGEFAYTQIEIQENVKLSTDFSSDYVKFCAIFARIM